MFIAKNLSDWTLTYVDCCYDCILLTMLTSVASDVFNKALWLDNELSARPPCGVTVSEQNWKYTVTAYKSFDEFGKFNVL